MKKVVCLLLICLLLSSCNHPSSNIPKETGITPHYEAEQPTLSATEPEDPQDILAYRRDLVEAEMRRAMSVLWTPAEDISYSLYSGSMGPEIDMQIVPDRVIHLKAGRIYRGSTLYNYDKAEYSSQKSARLRTEQERSNDYRDKNEGKIKRKERDSSVEHSANDLKNDYKRREK